MFELQGKVKQRDASKHNDGETQVDSEYIVDADPASGMGERLQGYRVT